MLAIKFVGKMFEKVCVKIEFQNRLFSFSNFPGAANLESLRHAVVNLLLEREASVQ